MTGPAVSTASPDSSGAPTLAESVGEFFGDYVSSGEPPAPESTSAAGTTPAEPATESRTSESSTAATEAPPPLSEGTTPAAATPIATDDDPFKDTLPLTYTVNGQQRTSDDIRVFKEGGAVIRPEALETIANRLSERDSLFERNRAQSAEYQTLAKVTEWQDEAGKTTRNGVEGAIELRIAAASHATEAKLLVDALTDPQRLVSLLMTEQVADGRGGVVERIVLNPDALRSLQREAALQVGEVSQAIRKHFDQVLQEAAKPQPAPIDFASATPTLIAKIAQASQLDASVLTPTDVKVLVEQLPFHVRDGLASVAWQNLVKTLIQDRIQHRASTQTLASATEKATKEGAARMAAAARGIRPTTSTARPAVPAPSPAAGRQQNEADLYDQMEAAGARALRSHV